MKIIISDCVVIQSRVIEHEGTKFRSVRIMEELEDGATSEISFTAPVEFPVPVLKNVSLVLEVSSYIKNFGNKLSIISGEFEDLKSK